MEITVSQIINFLAIAAGVIGSISAIAAFFSKINNKRIKEEREAIVNPINEQLEEIKKSQEELKKEMILVIKLNQTAVQELKTLGKVNGETTHALEELQNYLIEK
jgi:uncharacterized membrane protein